MARKASGGQGSRDAGKAASFSLPAPLAAIGAALAVGALGFGAAAGASTVAWVLAAVLAGSLALWAARQTQRARDAHEGLSPGLQDPLTGLPNRAGFDQRSSAALARARRRGESLTFFCLEVGDFPQVRLELGDAEAEDVLRRVSLEALAVLRGEDVLAHLGEGRFAGLAPDIGREDERRVLARIVSAIERAVPGRGALARVTVTAGSSCFPGSGQSLDDLFDAAERDLADVKADRARTAHRLHEELVPEHSVQECRTEGRDSPPGLGSRLVTRLRREGMPPGGSRDRGPVDRPWHCCA